MQFQPDAQDAKYFTTATKQCRIGATLRAFSKQAAERVLVGGSALANRRRGRLGHSLVLAYHNIIPAGEAAAGEHALHLPQRLFADQLDRLCTSHEVVSLTEIFAQPIHGTGRPRAAITFDDAYRGAVTAGISELQARALPATVFVAPAFVPDGTFWWDAFAGVNGELDPRIRAHALAQCRGEDASVRIWASNAGMQARELPGHTAVASGTELANAARIPGITIASHTWSHCNLAQLTYEQAREQLRASLAWVKEQFSSAIPWLSYPYGLSTPRVERLAQSLGYEGAVCISGGYVRPLHAGVFSVPRVNVSSALSTNGFRLRVAGLVDAG
jgi:peptidoglycan/xylan/chitin deacetylase (PgdA/CDA1 family)